MGNITIEQQEFFNGIKDDCIRTIDDINDEVVEKIKDIIKWI